MKINKKGMVKLGLTDLRVGNFVYSVERGHIKLQDISGVMSFRISTSVPRGQMLEYAFASAKKGDETWREYLHGNAAVLFNVLCAVPCLDKDEEGNVVFNYLDSINKLAFECAKRHPEMYGVKPDIGKEEDDAVLAEEKDTKEMEDRLKEGLEKK